MSSNAPDTDPQKRSGVEYLLQSGKIAGAGLWCPVFMPPSASACVQRGCPRYLALHDIRDAAVLDSDAYRRNGGVILPAGNRRSPTGIATSISRLTRCRRWLLTRCCC